ncbi:MAG: amidohydrolase family protein [Bacteroidota bacterium]
MKIQIVDGYVLLPNGIRKTGVEVVDGRITAIGRFKKDPKAVRVVASRQYVLPGFIDVHVNGTAGFDLTNGAFHSSTGRFSRQPHQYERGLESALNSFASNGTTLVGFTILEAPDERLKRILRMIANYRENAETFHNDMIFGIYLEGTFMREKQFRGAHNPSYFRTPSVRFFKELQRAAKGNIRIVNVVPEWGKPALELIQYLTSQGIIVATGHSGANGVQYQSAIEKGSSLAIHVMNGPSSSSPKSFNDGGVLETLLRSNHVYAEIIADGIHVDKRYVRDIIERKGIDKSVVITDSMFVGGMEGVKNFQVSGIKGRVSADGLYLQIEDRGDALFGSVLTMDRAFQNVMNWMMTSMCGVWHRQHNSCTFEEALFDASQLCSATPAKALGIYDPSSKNHGHNLSYGTGDIAVGKRGDLVLASIHQRRSRIRLTVNRTIVNGHLVHRHGKALPPLVN